ncbi:hypothetical protein PGN35_028465 [Nodosilinea sp. PGN35]|uniref:hypothetical protein n=1 Tax=Nodosilinea sp. PGN35 TaxID=3020489 RepID=UPI0023B31811|nr:hypothetical protein [Nodosilinea sp. TSF1-S3]MDF0365373.1 hypothetical protein [Nodosilinea sp. TSF1-S3]
MEEQKATKVTLYLPPDLHRQLKIRSAVEGEAMSSIAKRAIDFYLAHSDVVAESLEASFGQTHRIHSCPSCASSVVLREGELVEIASVVGAAPGGALGEAMVPEIVATPGSREEGELVVC